MSHFRVFGCEAFSHVPKEQRQKLDSKTTRCIFLGYGGNVKGYRLYDESSKKIFYDCDNDTFGGLFIVYSIGTKDKTVHNIFGEQGYTQVRGWERKPK